MALINFNKRKNKNEWNSIDIGAVARGTAILINNGSADFGKVNYSFTADKDVEEFKKQVSVHDEFFRKLESDPAYKDAASKISEMLDELDELDNAGMNQNIDE